MRTSNFAKFEGTLIENNMAYLIPTACLAVHLCIAFWFARNGYWRAVQIYAALLGAAALVTLWYSENAQGWDGLGHFIFAIFFMAPGVVGALIGGVLGSWKWRKSLSE